jgi:lysozyme
MDIGTDGLRLIQSFEAPNGPALKAYPDQAGIPTIGYGHIRGVKLGDTCTSEQAVAWLKEDVAEAVAMVNARVTRTLTQKQFDALVSFEFNTGCFASLGTKSTVCRRVNARDDDNVDDAMLEWNLVTDPATKQKIKSNGLVRRRTAEAALWNAGSQPAPLALPPAAAAVQAAADPAPHIGPQDGSGTVPVAVPPKPVATHANVLATAATAIGGACSLIADKVQPLLTYADGLKWVFLGASLVAILIAAIHAANERK